MDFSEQQPYVIYIFCLIHICNWGQSYCTINITVTLILGASTLQYEHGMYYVQNFAYLSVDGVDEAFAKAEGGMTQQQKRLPWKSHFDE